MIIKYPALELNLNKKLQQIYILTGSDPFLIIDARQKINKAWQKKHQSEKQIITIQNEDDWHLVQDTANSYSLFSEYLLLDVRYEKKSLLKEAVKIIKEYSENTNSKCLLILSCPNIPVKSLDKIGNHQEICLVQIYPFKLYEQKNWIITKLREAKLKFSADVPDIILQYSQGNMLASFQILNILQLVADSEQPLTGKIVYEYLIEQSEFSLYELRDACLQQNISQILKILKQITYHKFEPQLILWILGQEVRNLINLQHLLQNHNIREACAKLKIWPSQVNLYQNALNTLSIDRLYKILQHIQEIDVKIKTSQKTLIPMELEQVALLFAKNYK